MPGAPQEHRPHDGGGEQDFGQLGGRDRELGVHYVDLLVSGHPG